MAARKTLYWAHEVNASKADRAWAKPATDRLPRPRSLLLTVLHKCLFNFMKQNEFEWMNEWMNESLLFQYGSFSSVSKIGLALLGFVNGKKFLRYIFNQSAALPCTCSPGLDAGLASVLCVVTQRLSPYELRHDTKNGCKSIDSQYSCWWHCCAWDTFLLRVSEWNQFTSSQFSCGSAAYETCL